MKNPLIPFLAALALPASILLAAQTDIPGPDGSDNFGSRVTVLPNGNFLVFDPDFDQVSPAITDIGAVYLYAPDGALISTLTGGTANNSVGSNGATILSNGNFVIPSLQWDNAGATNAGAVTWGSATTGFIGGASVVVSATNSLIGGSTNDGVGSAPVIPLTNGNYVVPNPNWDNTAPAASNAGAVTWGNGSTGTVGLISSANSLVGTVANNNVGVSGTVALPNGNYVVRSPNWDNGGVLDIGAVTWGNGSEGTSGAVSVSNSLIGSTAGDSVGNSGVTVLTNGHYVVGSQNWDNTASAQNAGAATWGNGNGGTVGIVSTTNSLVGSTLNDNVGARVTFLTNGNYVVSSLGWDSPVTGTPDVGAVTWGNGNGGTVGAMNVGNSLLGTTNGDAVGTGVTALPNGNYVVRSENWNNPATSVVDVGAITWGNGRTGITGPVSAANSLIGSTSTDLLGNIGVTALTNGNYVVSSSSWTSPVTGNANVGAATWGNGSTGIKGVVSVANSLIGSTANDAVGNRSVTALTNGNYVVGSSSWSNPAASAAATGAATWGNGSTGTKGVVSVANSLVGSSTGDAIGSTIRPLTNGNYVVSTSGWNNVTTGVADVGSVTWGSGSTGVKGVVSEANSLVGATASDSISSGGINANGVTPLANGNYLVNSENWDLPGGPVDEGAVTWGNGSTGTTGRVSAANSLVGTAAGDIGFNGVSVQDDGNYIVRLGNFDGSAANTGAVVLGNGATGTVGLVSSVNGVLGTVVSVGPFLTFDYDPVRHRLIVGRSGSNIVTLFNTSLRSLAKTAAPAPGVVDIAYSTPGTTAVNAEGAALSDYTLIGAGSAGKNRALFAASATSGPLDLVLRKGDDLFPLGAGLPFGAKVNTILGQVMHQANRGLFQVTALGTGITTANDRLLLMDNGVGVRLLQRTGQPISLLSDASAAKFLEVVQSHDDDLITVSYQLKASAVPSITAANDTGILLLNHNGIVQTNIAAGEGRTVVDFLASGGTFGQFTGRATAIRSSRLHFGALLKPTLAGPALPGLFRMNANGSIKGFTSLGNDPAGATGVKFSSFPALSAIGSEALYKAILTGSTALNQSLWRGASTLLMRKGDVADPSDVLGIKITSILRFWPAGSSAVIVHVLLSGPGVTAANNQALILRQASGFNLVLMRTGTTAPGCGPAKVATLSAVDVNPITGLYAVLGTLSGAPATANQALWSGDATIGVDGTLPELRLPVLRLRKGQIYSTDSTPQSVVRSIAFKPAVDASGAGGRGLAQAIGSNGTMAVYILGDRSQTELVLLP